MSYGDGNVTTGRFCECGRPISARARRCRWCREYPTSTLADRFWVKVQKSDGCWLWMGARDTETGYGRIRRGPLGTTQELAHRVSWELTHGPIAGDLIVCHTCDNPPCVRSDHLFLGTYADNMQDALAKGRMATGDRWFAARPWAKRRSA